MPPADSAPASVAARAPGGTFARAGALARATAIGGVLALTVLTLAHPSATRMHTWPWAAISAFVWALPVAWLAARIAQRQELQLPPPLLASGLLLLAVSAVVAAWTSPFFETSLAHAWPTLGGVALMFTLHHWLSVDEQSQRVRLKSLAALIGIFSVVLVVTSLARWWPLGWSVRNEFPFGHSTYTGGVMVLLIPWCAFHAWRTHGWARAAWSATTAAGLVVLASTSSRGAVLALAAVAGMTAMAALMFAPWSRARKTVLLIAACALALGAMLGNPRLRDVLLERRWSDSARESNRQRSAMAEAGIRLGHERLAFGWGPGTVPLAYPLVRARLEGGVENVLQLHNAPLQVWATLGAAGALSLVLLAIGVARLVAGACAGARRVDADMLIAATASLGGYALFSLTDHQFDLPIVATLAAANLAILSASSSDHAVRVGAWGRGALLLAGAALVAGPGYARSRDLLARQSYERGVAAWEGGRSAEFITALDRAAAIAPHDPYFHHQAAGELLRQVSATSDVPRRRELTRAAMTRLEASLVTGAHTEFAHFNLGWLYLDLGDGAAAVRHFRAAAQRVPDKGGVYFGLGLALEQTGKHEEAIRAHAVEWINDPRHLTSPAWEVPALARLRPEIAAEMLRLYADLRRQYPPAGTAEAWARWWLDEEVPAATLGDGFNREAAEFADALGTLESGSSLGRNEAGWPALYAAWRQKKFEALAGGDAAYAAALERRAARHAKDFAAFLRAGTEDEAPLLRTTRRERLGYGVLAFHPAGPVLTDVYVVQENRVVADFAVRLFPPKGWLPGRFLLALLPPDSR